MKKIVQLSGSLIAGTGVIASSSYFEGCTDYYGPPPYSDYDEALEKCCQDAANYEKCVKAFEDNHNVCPANNEQKKQTP